MSREIDERIVQMKFENGQFEKGVQTSIHSLEELKRGLDFKDASKGLENLDKSAKGLKFDGLAAGIEALNNRFTLLGITGLNVMNRIANAAINTGETLIRSLSIDQVSAGWDKYANKTSAVQTIMSATAKEFTDTAEQMEYVNAQLDKLNWFTDETSYNFLDMVSNIGKFTSNNIPLDRSVTSMQGIATWAAQSGANVNEASRAMYNLSQAISSGSLRLQDWMSIENANMGTARFKETVIETALELGTLKKAGDKVVTSTKGLEVSVTNFRNVLAEGWITGDVLVATLEKYGAATNKLNEIVEKTGTTTSVLIGYIDEYSAGTLDLDAASKELGLSVEETKAYMEEFQTETMQFGLEAFKAAQEAKTFSEAIQSVKDAVSSGWMNTFELIFGDYEEAKTLWTDVANILYSIFAESGNSRNELLEGWAEIGGRFTVLSSIYNLFSALLKIMTSVKEAWRSVFPAQTPEGLLSITQGIADFTQKLIISDDAAETLKTALRGIFLVLDTGRYIVTNIIKKGFGLLSRVLAELNIDVSGLSNGFTAMMENINAYVKNETWLTRAFDAFGDILVSVIQRIKNFIAAVKEFGPVKTVLDAFHSAITADFNGISSVVTFLGNAFADFFTLIANTPFPKSLSDVKDFFVEFGEAATEELSNVGVSFADFLDKLLPGFESLSKASDTAMNGFGQARDVIADAIRYIGAAVKEVDWSGVTLLGTGVVIVYLINKIAETVVAVSNSLLAFTDIGKSIQKVFKSTAKVLDSTAEVVSAAKWTALAVAIGILSAAVYALSKIPKDDLAQSIFYIGILGGALVALTAAIGSIKSTNSATGYLISFAGVLLAFTLAMNSLDISDVNAVQNKIMVIMVMLGTLVGACFLMTKIEGTVSVGATSMVTIVASLWLLIKLLNSLSKYDQKELFKAVPLMATLVLILAAVNRLMSSVTTLEEGQHAVKPKTLTNTIAIIIGLYGMVHIIKKLGETDPEVILTGILNLVPIMAALVTLFSASNRAGQYAAKAGLMILEVSLALNLLIPTIKRLAELPIKTIAKGGAVITALSVLVFKPLIKATKDAGPNAAKAGLMLLAMAGTMAILQLVVKTLGKVDLASLAKGVAAVSILNLSLVPAIEALGTSNGDAVKGLKKITILVGLVGAIVFILANFTDTTKALAAAASMALILTTLVVPLHVLDTLKTPDVKIPKELIIILGVLGVMVALLSSSVDNPAAAISAATAMSAVLLALSASIKIMDGTKKPSMPNAKAMLVWVGTVGAVLALLIAVGKDANPATCLALATAMSEILLALSVSVVIMSNTRSKPSLANAKAMALFVAAIGAVMVLLGQASKSADPVTALALATGMSEILIALGAAARLMTKTKMPDLKTIGTLSLFVAAVGGVLTLLSTFGNMDNLLMIATGISELLLSLSISMRILDNVKIEGGTIGSMGVMIGLATLTGILIGALSYMVNPESVLPIVLGMSTMMLAMAGVVAVLSLIPAPNITSAISAVATLVIFVGGMGLLLTAIGGLIGDANAAGVIASGGEVLKQIGIAIGGFVGGILGGFIGGAAEGVMASFPAICKSLSDGTANLLPFFDNLKAMPTDILGLIGTITGVVAAITAAEFISGLEAIPIVGGLIKEGKENIKENFSLLGEALSEFSNKVVNIDAYKVKSAAEAVAALATATQSIPAEGGLFGALFGDIDLDKFAENVPKLGQGLADFAVKTVGITDDSLKGAINAATMLVELENSLPREGGVLQSFIGSQDMASFGSRLVTFGMSLAAFSNLMSLSLNEDGVEKAKQAGDLMVSLETSLPREGGILQNWFLGNKDLGSFGSNLETFGAGLVALSDKCALLNTTGINNAVTAGKSLAELENSLTKESGGALEFWFGGESSFKTFGDNLAWFGQGLASLSSNASRADFTVLDEVIEFIETIGDVGNMGTATGNLVEAVKKMFDDIDELIRTENHDILDSAKRISKNMVDGIIIGLAVNQNRALDRMTGFAKALVTRFEDELKIHSPSVVMKEKGEYIVEGVAEGIAGNTSAEEAASQKAQNIVDAFQTIFDDADFRIDFSNIKLESWQVRGGRGASWAEVLEHDLKARTDELNATGDKVQAAYAKYIALQRSGANEKSVRQAEIDYIKMSNTYQSLRNDIIDTQIESSESMIEELDLLDDVRQAEYDAWLSSKEGKNATAAEKTNKEMELLVSQLDTIAQTTAILRSKHQAIVEEFGEDSTEARNAYIKVKNSEQKLNETYDSIMEQQYGAYNTIREARDASFREYNEFISEYSEQLTKMGFTMEQIRDEAARMSKLDMYFGDSVTTEYSKEDIENIMAKAEEPVNLVKENLVNALSTEMVESITVQLVDGIPLAISKSAPKAKEASEVVADAGVEGITPMVEEFEEIGNNAGDTLANALYKKAEENYKKARDSAILYKTAYEDALGIASPSKVMIEIAGYMSEGLIIGLRQNGSNAQSAAEEMANRTVLGFSNLVSRISELANADIDIEPTVTPVLDMDNIISGAKDISGILNSDVGLDVSSIDFRTRKLQANLKSDGLITSGANETIVNNNFTQNNYSPKALSRYDIYRQTRNQISQLKGVAPK